MEFIIEIEIKPYLKKFIAKDYETDPFVLTTNNLYGLFLFNCLQQPSPKLLKLIRQSPSDILPANVYSDKLKLQLSENYWNKCGCIITDIKRYHFNKFVSYQFHEEFYKYVQNRSGKKGSINRSILEFREKYSITDDELTFKTIQRAFQRRNKGVIRSLSA